MDRRWELEPPTKAVMTLLLLRGDLDTESATWNNAYSVGEALVAAAVYAAKGQPLGGEMRDDLTKRLQESVGSLIPHHDQNIRRVIDALGTPPEKTTTAATQAKAVASAAQAKRTEPTAKRGDSGPVEAPASDEDQKVADKLGYVCLARDAVLDASGESAVGTGGSAVVGGGSGALVTGRFPSSRQ